jgi:hypothetical protein
MKNSLKTLLFSTVLILFVVSSCSKDESESELIKEGGPFAISELTGNWKATSANFWRASDGLQADIIADGGSVSLTVQSSGRCTFTVDPFDREAYTVSGEMFWGLYVDEDDDDEEFEALVIVWDDSPDDRSSFRSLELTDTTFNIGCTSECGEYDFNNNGTYETADLVFGFIRN